MARLEAPVTNTRRRAPAARASSTAYWMRGLSTTGSISFGLALVAGRKRVPRPATGNTAVRIEALELLIGHPFCSSGQTAESVAAGVPGRPRVPSQVPRNYGDAGRPRSRLRWHVTYCARGRDHGHASHQREGRYLHGGRVHR